MWWPCFVYLLLWPIYQRPEYWFHFSKHASVSWKPPRFDTDQPATLAQEWNWYVADLSTDTRQISAVWRRCTVWTSRGRIRPSSTCWLPHGTAVFNVLAATRYSRLQRAGTRYSRLQRAVCHTVQPSSTCWLPHGTAVFNVLAHGTAVFNVLAATRYSRLQRAATRYSPNWGLK